jgi:hypothetical protein
MLGIVRELDNVKCVIFRFEEMRLSPTRILRINLRARIGIDPVYVWPYLRESAPIRLLSTARIVKAIGSLSLSARHEGAKPTYG